MKQVIAGFLVLVFAGQATASDAPQQVSAISKGAYVEVRFTDKTKARGYLDRVEPDGFSFSTGKTAAGRTLRRAAFSEVESVRVVQRTHTPIAAWIATGVIAAVVVVVVAVFLIERHNE